MTVPALASTLPNLAAFCRTYETGSFTKAARSLEVTPQATSRSVARLERELGITLFRRTTRSLSPTEAGRRYYERCIEALSLLSAGEREIASGQSSLGGHVRLSVPTTYGHHRLLPSLGAFRERYPDIRVDVSVSNQNVDFVHDDYDVAIRMGTIRDQSLVARKIGEFALGVYASSAYLARRRAPRKPADLAAHDCIAFVMPRSGKILPWTFAPAPESWVPEARYRCSDDVLGVIGLARAGVGLVQIYDFLVEADVARGTLVEVLTPFRGKSRPFSLVYPKSVAPSRAVRTMIDFIVANARPDVRPARG